MSITCPLPDLETAPIAVIGLGYVGLPLAVEFGKTRPVIGFDINPDRIAELKQGQDTTLEVSPEELAASAHLNFTSELSDIAKCQVFIVTVPTPIDTSKTPDLRPLRSASRSVGSVLKRGDVVIYESTVYPGATEEDCAPLLEELSGLTLNTDFSAGYSPERINPGDKSHRLTDIVKVTSGSHPEAADFVDALYASIITAGTYKAENIRVAEAAKVIENTQRDLNIALVNELAVIFGKLGIDTEAVLQAAGTKWNFLPFRPGLVGGHCIGVDPYYLTHKAEAVGHSPEIILAGRRMNDGMGAYVAHEMIRNMALKGIHVGASRVLVMGLAFKENCPDIRNTKVIDVIEALQSYGVTVDVFDPWIDPEETQAEYGITPVAAVTADAYDGLVLAVAHQEFRAMSEGELRAPLKEQHVIYDVKAMLPRGMDGVVRL
ncbi:MAG: Vi polysaccharide biosynthesis UDP-N-acetylglucosamine C-6 dehydrogenase TviB [Rhodobacteraceae bacterium]|nr:Vi polysaccharide biosynthesis UDP-N-acetylglucosamine C-6 dehydrogenase TviB [Paracoccaceae bacterium]